jgi:hypothetical protein
MVCLAWTWIAISMGTTSAVLLPAESNAEAFASPMRPHHLLHALTSHIQVEPVVLREAAHLCANNSIRELFAVSFPVAAVRQFKYRRRYEHYMPGKNRPGYYYYIL